MPTILCIIGLVSHLQSHTQITVASNINWLLTIHEQASKTWALREQWIYIRAQLHKKVHSIRESSPMSKRVQSDEHKKNPKAREWAVQELEIVDVNRPESQWPENWVKNQTIKDNWGTTLLTCCIAMTVLIILSRRRPVVVVPWPSLIARVWPSIEYYRGPVRHCRYPFVCFSYKVC